MKLLHKKWTKSCPAESLLDSTAKNARKKGVNLGF